MEIRGMVNHSTVFQAKKSLSPSTELNFEAFIAFLMEGMSEQNEAAPLQGESPTAEMGLKNLGFSFSQLSNHTGLIKESERELDIDKLLNSVFNADFEAESMEVPHTGSTYLDFIAKYIQNPDGGSLPIISEETKQFLLTEKESRTEGDNLEIDFANMLINYPIGDNVITATNAIPANEEFSLVEEMSTFNPDRTKDAVNLLNSGDEKIVHKVDNTNTSSKPPSNSASEADFLTKAKSLVEMFGDNSNYGDIRSPQLKIAEDIEPQVTEITNFINNEILSQEYSGSNAAISQVETVSPDTLYPRINREELIDVAVRNFKALRLPGTTEIKVILKPKELGEISIRVILDKGQINGNITASNREVYNSLQSNIEVLKQELRSSNLNLTNISVNIADNGDFNGQGTFHNQHQGFGGYKPKQDNYHDVQGEYLAQEDNEGIDIIA